MPPPEIPDDGLYVCSGAPKPLRIFAKVYFTTFLQPFAAKLRQEHHTIILARHAGFQLCACVLGLRCSALSTAPCFATTETPCGMYTDLFEARLPPTCSLCTDIIPCPVVRASVKSDLSSCRDQLVRNASASFQVSASLHIVLAKQNCTAAEPDHPHVDIDLRTGAALPAIPCIMLVGEATEKPQLPNGLTCPSKQNTGI
jgi:hypothetical protein